jgi:hypothetical protein
MKYLTLPLLAASAILSGCAVTAGFSPVQGPLSKQSPVPTYTASVSGIVSSGNISVVLENGEVCKGPWALVSQAAAGKSNSTASNPSTTNVSADWDSVYGPGYYVAHVVGNRLYARAVLVGNMGTILNVEFSNERNVRGNTKGVAEDNKGNIFKVSVYN